MEELLLQLRIPIASSGHHHNTPNRVQVDCPYCSKDSHRFRMGISKNGFSANCWVCGKHPIIETISLLSGLPWKTVKSLMKGMENDHQAKSPKAKGVLQEPEGLGELLRCHIDYLERRGFDVSELQRCWGIRGIGRNGGTLKFRIYIPIHYHGEVVSWTTRAIVDDIKDRYRNVRPEQEAIPAKTLLYGEDHVRGNTIIIVEGPCDVWRVGAGAVCTFGTTVTTAQVSRMSKYRVRVLFFDRAKEAQQAARKVLQLLSPFSGECYNIRPNSKDPGDSSIEDIREIRKTFLGDIYEDA